MKIAIRAESFSAQILIHAEPSEAMFGSVYDLDEYGF